jgi:hypothetical protein
MNVNVVCSRLRADRVLPRLARTLAAGTGWNLGETPDAEADVNLFFPYLELQNVEWRDTLSAAWFTHKDVTNRKKAALWEDIAGRVDLRLTSTPMYLPELRRHGPTEYVRVAVERDRFTPSPERGLGRTVGVAGYTYGDGRKGEDLIAKLAGSEVGRTCRWKASGRGWPVDTEIYHWKDMPRFYQGLDLLVCASRSEGPGMPPLEALSCGVPVIVPRGVGIFDELPDMCGIWRFEAGDYGSLLETFAEAIRDDEPPGREALRAATEFYTAANWCADCIEAVEGLVLGKFEEGDLSDWHGNTGMYLVAFGGPSRECAGRCITSFKRHNPGVPVALAATEPLGPEDIFIQHEDADIGGRKAKLAVDSLVPENWRYVLYLDADQEVVEPLGFLFDLLQAGWEFVICKDMTTRFRLSEAVRSDNQEEHERTIREVGTDEIHQYNGGLFAYRRTPRTKRFFEIWNQEWQRWAGRDQGALVRALYRYPLKMYVLGNQWNASDRYDPPPGPLAVIHHNIEARRWTGAIEGRLDSEAAWEAVRAWETQHGES